MIRKSILIFAYVMLLFCSCKDDRWKEIESSKSQNHNIRFIDFDLSLYKFSKSIIYLSFLKSSILLKNKESSGFPKLKQFKNK